MVITGVGGNSPAGGGTYVGLSGSEIGTFITIVTGVPVIGFSKPGSKPFSGIKGYQEKGVKVSLRNNLENYSVFLQTYSHTFDRYDPRPSQVSARSPHCLTIGHGCFPHTPVSVSEAGPSQVEPPRQILVLVA